MKTNSMKGEEKPPILKIITIDNCPVIVKRIQSMLTDMDNVNLLTDSSTASTALDLISQQKPNVVILDIHLEMDEKEIEKYSEEINKIIFDIHLEKDSPGANGISLLNTIRKKHPHVKIVILTNLIDLQYRLNCIAYGADYFLDKSRDFEKIPETLKKILSDMNKLS
jgi:DNA-binding NarL/FixJ family response regulator